jgi:heme/copper-type cytochrome/quinol oxidase subunit 2
LAPPRTRARRLLVSLGAVLLALAATAAPAGANLLTPESPHSPNADDITTLYVIVMIAVVAIIVKVNFWLLFGVSRNRARRGHQARDFGGLRRLQSLAVWGLAGFAVMLFAVSVYFTEGARDPGSTGPEGLQTASALTEGSGAAPIGGQTPSPSQNADPLEITATAQQWLWRYTYPNGAFSYYRLVVPVDTAVKLRLVSTDVVHGWYVPSLGGKSDAVPGKTNYARFRADETGTYEGRSSTFSGAAYAAARIAVEVVTPDEYEAFVEQQRSDIQEAQDIVVEQIQSGDTP